MKLLMAIALLVCFQAEAKNKKEYLQDISVCQFFRHGADLYCYDPATKKFYFDQGYYTTGATSGKATLLVEVTKLKLVNGEKEGLILLKDVKGTSVKTVYLDKEKKTVTYRGTNKNVSTTRHLMTGGIAAVKYLGDHYDGAESLPTPTPKLTPQPSVVRHADEREEEPAPTASASPSETEPFDLPDKTPNPKPTVPPIVAVVTAEGEEEPAFDEKVCTLQKTLDDKISCDSLKNGGCFANVVKDFCKEDCAERCFQEYIALFEWVRLYNPDPSKPSALCPGINKAHCGAKLDDKKLYPSNLRDFANTFSPGYYEYLKLLVKKNYIDENLPDARKLVDRTKKDMAALKSLKLLEADTNYKANYKEAYDQAMDRMHKIEKRIKEDGKKIDEYNAQFEPGIDKKVEQEAAALEGQLRDFLAADMDSTNVRCIKRQKKPQYLKTYEKIVWIHNKYAGCTDDSFKITYDDIVGSEYTDHLPDLRQRVK